MNVYDAIMKAADHIESFPQQFNFKHGIVPGSKYHTCGAPSCALGWIGHFAATHAWDYTEVCEELFGFDRWMFYRRLDALMGGHPRRGPEDSWGLLDSWARTATDCAKALRLYAAKYHAPAKPQRTDSELVADLMTRVTSGERIPEDVAP